MIFKGSVHGREVEAWEELTLSVDKTNTHRTSDEGSVRDSVPGANTGGIQGRGQSRPTS